MQDKLKQISQRYAEIEQLANEPAILSNPTKYAALMKERGALTRIIQRIKALEEIRKQKAEAHHLATEQPDKELAQMAQEEIDDLTQQEEKILEELEEMLLAKQSGDMRNVIMEIRAGTGGNEAALFVADMFRLYHKYSEKKSWKLDLINSNPTNLGGFKEIIFSLEGPDVYKHMRFESGTHRVQRVPRTEASGRLHTSACTVAVMPEPDQIEIQIKSEDLKIDTYGAGGPGGQHVNKTDSAIRITHLPTGLVVTSQSERSQHRNRDLAMRLLRSRLYEHEQKQARDSRDSMRRHQIGSGDRSEKIRTYNFPQNRITDHRINFSLHSLDKVMDGDIDELIKRLIQVDKEKRLAQMSRK